MALTKKQRIQKISWMWKGKRGYRILKPGQPAYFVWKNGKPLTIAEQTEFEESLAW